MGDTDSIPGSGRSPEGGNGNPLQYSCLENPMDRGALWTTAQRVTKSQTQWSNWVCLTLYEYVCLWVTMYMRVSMCLCVYLTLCVCVCVCVCVCDGVYISVCPCRGRRVLGVGARHAGCGQKQKQNHKEIHRSKGSYQKETSEQGKNVGFQSKTCPHFLAVTFAGTAALVSATWSVWLFSSWGSESRCRFSSELLS